MIELKTVTKPPPPSGGLESIIGTDERVRILDTDLAPWRMICALRMTSPVGSTAVGTGWFVGPRTIVSAQPPKKAVE